jgi:hypothetical protein
MMAAYVEMGIVRNSLKLVWRFLDLEALGFSLGFSLSSL